MIFFKLKINKFKKNNYKFKFKKNYIKSLKNYNFINIL